nr:MAG TPA: DNA polymerase II small subunit [Caudoviricetes sp.]
MARNLEDDLNEKIDRAILEEAQKPRRERMSNVALGRMFDVHETTIRRHKQALQKALRLPVERDRDEFFDIPVNAITQRRRTIRLEDGSYERVTYNPAVAVAEDVREASYEELEKVFDRAALAVAPKVEEDRPKTLVVCLSDFQVGKTDSLGGTQETVNRVMGTLKRITEWIQAKGSYEEIIIADVGDVCEGFWNVTSQQQTNDLSLTDQIRVAQRLMAEAVAMLAPLCTRMTYVSIPSNHCAVRTSKGNDNRANSPDDDFGLLIADTIQAIMSGREPFSHVNFAKPQKWEEAVTVETADGTAVGFTHGHLAGSQAKIPSWFRDLAFGHRSGLHEASILVHGHFHNFGVSLVGDNKFIIGCPTADNGSSWFTNRTGDATDPALLTFEVQDKKAKRWELWYE